MKPKKILVTTQRVDYQDGELGFFNGWIIELAKHFEFVTVICLFKGQCDLPSNVRVFSLGKEKNRSGNFLSKMLAKLKYAYLFYSYIFSQKDNYDAVFVHMNQIYVLLGAWWWKINRKRIFFWYTHKKVSVSLRMAEKMVDKIFTASRKSFRLESKKVNVVGHGIDLEKFVFSPVRQNLESIRIVTVGRISPAKDYETLIFAAERLKQLSVNFNITIVGSMGKDRDSLYFDKLRQQVQENKLEGSITFLGSVPNYKIVNYLREADLFINMSFTGSLDKACLEAISCGLPVITCNESLIEEVLVVYKEILSFKKGDAEDLAEKIKNFLDLNYQYKIKMTKQLQELVVRQHSLSGLGQKIAALMKI